MSWGIPKNDWDTDDVIATTDLNRIEENAITLHKGNGQAALASITAANNMDINETDETFLVTGNTSIFFIKTTGRQAGNKIILIFSGTTMLWTNKENVPANYANIRIKKLWDGTGGPSESNISVYAFTSIELIYDGTHWILIS